MTTVLVLSALSFLTKFSALVEAQSRLHPWCPSCERTAECRRQAPNMPRSAVIEINRVIDANIRTGRSEQHCGRANRVSLVAFLGACAPSSRPANQADCTATETI